MFYTGLDPRTMKEVYVPKSKREKAMQRALLQYSAPRNYDLVHRALVEAGREDLIGFGPRCLIKPKDARGARGALNRQFDKNKKNSKSNDRNSKGGRSNKSTDRRKSNSKDSRNTNTRE